MSSEMSVTTDVSISVVIVNWRESEMTLRAVSGALEQSRPPDQIYVIDNGSGDGSVDRLRQAFGDFGDKVVLLPNDRNVGFGAGCNIGIREAISAGHSHIWLLNNDAVPERDCLDNLLRTASTGPGTIGAVGSLLIDPHGNVSPHFGSWMRVGRLTCKNVEVPADLDRKYSWCTAASLLLDAAAIAEIGGFDEDFFMYWEDADLNLRLREAGYSVVCAPDARVMHEAGSSSNSIPVQRYLWHFASQRRFLQKHHGSPRMVVLRLRLKYLLKAVIDRDLPRFRALSTQR